LSSAADRPGLLLAAAYLAAVLWGLGAADIVGDDEAREAGIVQAIVAGDWLLPRFNAETLPDKPLLFHWLAALPCAAAGFSEVAVRAPSAIAGAALVGWTARFGTALFGRPTGPVAALLVATTPALFVRARVARPDVVLVLLLALALARAFHWWSDGRRGDATAALALLGAATLAKGPVAPALFATTLLGFLAWQRDLGRLPRLLTPAGLALFGVLGLGWYAVALAGWGDLFVREHLAGRYVGNLLGDLPAGGPYSHRAAGWHLIFYVQRLPAITVPWSAFAALALWQAWHHSGPPDPRLRFLVCWAMAPVVVFTPAAVKLRYYLLPAIPAVALLAAPAVVALWRASRPAGAPRPAALLAAAGGLLVGALSWAAAADLLPLAPTDRATIAVVLARIPGAGSAVAVASVLGLGTAALLYVTARRTWKPLLCAVVAGSVASMVLAVPVLEQAVSRRDSLRDFARGVAARHPAPAPLAFYEEPVRSVAVYLGRPVPTLRRPEALTPGLALIARGAAYRSLADSGAVGPPLLRAEGRVGNLARGRLVLAETRSRAQDRPPLRPRR
jgi:4-amino-4-deoxy-L-arabinose transferase-like glycosyltransferase